MPEHNLPMTYAQHLKKRFRPITNALNAGADGYVLKNSMSEEVLEGIQTVVSGKRFLCEEVGATLNNSETKTLELTRREIELLQLIADGLTLPQLADKMCLGIETIRSYRKNLNVKLDAHNTAQLLQKAKAFLHYIVMVTVMFILGCNNRPSNSEEKMYKSYDFSGDPIFQLKGQAKIDSALYLVETGSNDKKMLGYYILAWDYAMIDGNRSRKYSNELLRLALQEKQKIWEGWAYGLLGSSYEVEKRYDSAIFYLEKGLAPFEEIKNFELVMVGKGAIAGIYKYLFRYDDALKIFLENLDIVEREGLSKEYTARYLQQIANMYFIMNLHDLSIDYLERAIDTFKSLDRDERMIRDIGCCYSSIGNNFLEKKEYQNAIENLEKALEFFREIDDTYYSIYSLRDLVTCYLELDKDEEALKTLNELEIKAKPRKNKFFNFTTAQLKAKYNLKQEQYKNALLYAHEALSYVNDSDKSNLADIYATLSLASAKAGTPDETAGYIKKYVQLSDEKYDEDRNKNVAEMEAKYETEKKELKITALEAEKRLMTWLSIAGGAVLFMALVAFFFLWRWTVQKRRISEQQHQLAETRILQLEQEKQLIAAQALLDGETQERTRLARDLHDGLGSILAGAKLNFQEMKRGAQMDADTVQRYEVALDLLDQSVREMRRVAHHLMPEALSNSGLKQAIADFCRSIPIAAFRFYGEEIRFDPKNELMLYRTMHELVNNALKHSGASRIMVQIVSEPNRIALTVQDDGRGFDPSAKFEGVGLANIRTRVAACNGTLMVDSKPNVGTEVSVELGV